MFACQPGEDAVVRARDGAFQLLYTDVEGGRPVDNVPLVLGHLRAARLTAIVRPETVALEKVSEGDVVTTVVQHLDYTGQKNVHMYISVCVWVSVWADQGGTQGSWCLCPS